MYGKWIWEEEVMLKEPNKMKRGLRGKEGQERQWVLQACAG
jgi:hypothetical protein